MSSNKSIKNELLIRCVNSPRKFRCTNSMICIPSIQPPHAYKTRYYLLWKVFNTINTEIRRPIFHSRSFTHSLTHSVANQDEFFFEFSRTSIGTTVGLLLNLGITKFCRLSFWLRRQIMKPLLLACFYTNTFIRYTSI